jgi:sugar/nucleoside kinase (ribokinase family)
MNVNGAYDVTGVGNAIVDILANADEKFLVDHKLAKGMMTLINGAHSQSLSSAAKIIKRQSGGSAANTIAGIASFGGKCAFIGKTADDELGQAFRHDLTAQGIDFRTPTGNAFPTARCTIFITPDAQRTMATYLGISTEITPDDLDATKISNAKVTYLEGYLFDKPAAKDAFHAAASMAHKAGKLLSLTLSDPFCVDRHRADFQKLVSGHIDILFANEMEMLSLYTSDNFEQALSRMADKTAICVVTRSEKGATILFHGKKFDIPAVPVSKVIDTTGAGDLFAAGFLYGFTQDMDPVQCGRLGAKAAANIIAQVGARPQIELKELLAA